MTTVCKAESCERTASEANGLCFYCAEEIAFLTWEAVLEFSGDAEAAKAAAQATWKEASA